VHESSGGSARRPGRGTGRSRAWLLVLLLVPTTALAAKSIVAYLQRPGFGEFCLKPCRTGFCHAPGGSFMHAYCTRGCAGDSDCPADYVCAAGSEGSGSFCRRAPHGKSGDRCGAPEECLSGHCIEYLRVDPKRGHYRSSYCVEACAPGAGCPDGNPCEQVGGVSVCSPTQVITRDAERRFDLEMRMGIENEATLDRRLVRSQAADGGGPAR
jgi:hypothetical protein